MDMLSLTPTASWPQVALAQTERRAAGLGRERAPTALPYLLTNLERKEG
jgi:hypothetical protein